MDYILTLLNILNDILPIVQLSIYLEKVKYTENGQNPSCIVFRFKKFIINKDCLNIL